MISPHIPLIIHNDCKLYLEHQWDLTTVLISNKSPNNVILNLLQRHHQQIYTCHTVTNLSISPLPVLCRQSSNKVRYTFFIALNFSVFSCLNWSLLSHQNLAFFYFGVFFKIARGPTHMNNFSIPCFGLLRYHGEHNTA